MDDPDIVCNLHNVNHPEGIAFQSQGDLEYAGSHTEHGLRDIGQFMTPLAVRAAPFALLLYVVIFDNTPSSLA
jgi:hypothetical protein